MNLPELPESARICPNLPELPESARSARICPRVPTLPLPRLPHTVQRKKKAVDEGEKKIDEEDDVNFYLNL